MRLFYRYKNPMSLQRYKNIYNLQNLRCTICIFCKKSMKNILKPLQLTCFYEVYYSFYDSVFVQGIVFFLEVVLE